MDQLIAQWDFEASDERELSFKKGDRIKLLEKHNDDWWEGELNSYVGLFPRNRVVHDSSGLEYDCNLASEPIVSTVGSSTFISGTLQQTDSIILEKDDPSSATAATVLMENLNLLSNREDTENSDSYHEPLPRLESLFQADITQLALSQLRPSWIRHKGHVQMKMAAEKDDGGKISSWKAFNGVLCKGFLLLYKDKDTKKSKFLVPVGIFDLADCDIKPARELDTKRKCVFLVTLPRKVTMYIETQDKADFSTWLDAIGKDLYARKEVHDDNSDILRLLQAVSSDFRQMKVNKKLSDKQYPDTKDKYRKNYDGIDYDDGKIKNRGFRLHKFASGKGDERSKALSSKSRSSPTAAGGNIVFGGKLYLEDDGGPPRVVRLCIEEIEKRGLESVGVYRLSGSKTDIQKYRLAFNQNEAISFANEDINAVAGLLKLYFRELQDPLFTHDFYDGLIEAAREEDYNECMFRIKSYIHALPEENYTVLEYLMRHLSSVSNHCEINKMETTNLALIFSVGLLRPLDGELSGLINTDLTSKVIEAIIQQVEWFFEPDEYYDDEDLVNEGEMKVSTSPVELKEE